MIDRIIFFFGKKETIDITIIIVGYLLMHYYMTISFLFHYLSFIMDLWKLFNASKARYPKGEKQ